MLADLTVHEAMPGHYLQIMHSVKEAAVAEVSPGLTEEVGIPGRLQRHQQPGGVGAGPHVDPQL